MGKTGRDGSKEAFPKKLLKNENVRNTDDGQFKQEGRENGLVCNKHKNPHSLYFISRFWCHMGLWLFARELVCRGYLLSLVKGPRGPLL